MTREKAHRLLDGHRAGVYLTASLVNEALMATGDIGRTVSSSPVWEVPEFDDDKLIRIQRRAGTWERKATGLAPAAWHEALTA